MTIPAPLQEALKELGRLLLIAVVSVMITGGVDLLVNSLGSGLSLEVKVMIASALTGFLRSVDKWLHELGKENDNAKLTKGLTGF